MKFDVQVFKCFRGQTKGKHRQLPPAAAGRRPGDQDGWVISWRGRGWRFCLYLKRYRESAAPGSEDVMSEVDPISMFPHGRAGGRAGIGESKVDLAWI